jgi:hypothetical protein
MKLTVLQGIDTYQDRYSKLRSLCILWLILGKESKRELKLTVPQEVLQQSHYVRKKLSKKSSEIFPSQRMLKNATYIYEVARVFLYLFIRQMDVKYAALVKINS